MTKPKRTRATPTCSSSSSSSTIINSSSPPPAIIKADSTTTTKLKPKRPRKNNDNASSRITTTTSGARSSKYRGVTRHRWTGRYEAHLWDKNSWNNGNSKKGKQVYLGAYDCEEAAAHTYDLAALKYWGPETILNFPAETYNKELEEMQKVSREEYLASLRRVSSGFSRGVSKYRGVARHHHNGRWEARIGRVYGNKYLYLGTYNSQEEAAEAYDMAALEYRGPTAVTNFDINIYVDRLKMKGIDIMSPQNSISQFEQQLPPQQQAEAEVEVEQQQQQPEQLPMIHKVEEQILQPQVPEYIDFTNNPTQPMVMMDDSTIDHGLDWSFCMDPTVGFTNELNVSDFSFQETSSSDDFQGLKFEDIDFDGNIDLMFESISSWPYNGSEGVYLESESRSSFELATNDQAINCNGTSNEGVGLGKAEDKEEGKDRKMCASSPATSSASTSVSCSYLV